MCYAGLWGEGAQEPREMRAMPSMNAGIHGSCRGMRNAGGFALDDMSADRVEWNPDHQRIRIWASST